MTPDARSPWLESLAPGLATSRIKFTSYVKARVGWQNLTTDEHQDVGPYLVTGTDFVDGVIDWNDCHHVSEDRYRVDPYIQLREGDLLLTKDGTIGKVAVVGRMPGPATLNSGIFVVRPLLGVYVSRFLYWVVNSALFSEFIRYKSQGSTIQHLYQNVFETFEFPLPSPPQQLAVAAFLDRKTAAIDALIAKKERMIELLQEKRQALIMEAVTKGLNPSVPMKESGIPWIGAIPLHWEIHQLRRVVARFIDYRGRTPTKVDDGVPLITAGAVRDGTIDHSRAPEYMLPEEYDEFMRRGLPQHGDVVFTTEAPLGEVAQVTDTSVAFAQRIILFKVNRARMTSDFLWLYYCADAGRCEVTSRASGSTAEGIRADRLRASLVVVPPIDEQSKIVNWVRAQLSRAEPIGAIVEAQLDKLREYRQALITAAVTGKVDVSSEAA